MNLDQMRSELEALTPLFLFAENKRKLRVIEKSGRIMCDVSADSSLDEATVANEIRCLFRNSENSACSEDWPILRPSIHLTHETIRLRDAGGVVRTIAGFLGASAQVRVVIHLGEPEAHWSEIRSVVQRLRESIDRPENLFVEIIDQLSAFDAQEFEHLFNLGVRVRFAVGCPHGGAARPDPEVELSLLRAVSELGFRTCVEWYVDKENTRLLKQQLTSFLVANCYSGFSLPLASSSPFYRFDPTDPPLPDAVEYCRLLSGCYKEYPFYDDVCSPLTDLAMRFSQGAYSLRMGIPSVCGFTLTPAGQIAVFRQAHALAMPWISTDDALAIPRDQLQKNFLDFASSAGPWKLALRCSTCSWRYLCGGVDSLDHLSLSDSTMDTLCLHRRLFLEHFATLRAPNAVFGAS